MPGDHNGTFLPELAPANPPPTHCLHGNFLLRIFLLCLLALPCLAKFGVAQSTDNPPPVVAVAVREAQVNSGYRVVGSVQPLRTSQVGSGADGRVADFLVDVGQAVKAGQPMAQLLTRTLEIELLAARAELELCQQQYAEVRNGSRKEEIAEAKAMFAAARITMDNAKSELRRLQQLNSTGVATTAELDDARALAENSTARYEAAQASYERIQAGPRDEQIAQRLAQVDMQSQQVALIEDRIAKHTIRAPFDGFVVAEFTEMGAWIKQGDPVVQVMQLDQVEVVLPVTADYVSRLELGSTVRVEFPELPEQLLTGTIDRIVPFSDSRSRTYPVYVRVQNRLQNSVPLLMAGMLARVELPAGAKQLLPLVPKDALVLNDRARYVVIVEPEADNPQVGIARRVDVDLGVSVGTDVQVLGKIKAGDMVVIVGNERLSEGDRVSLVSRDLTTPRETAED